MEQRVNVKERSFRSRLLLAVLLVGVGWLAGIAPAQAAEEEVEQLRKIVEVLTRRIEALEEKQDAGSAVVAVQHDKIQTLSTKVDELGTAGAPSRNTAFDKLHVGAYGELHANFGEADDPDLIDLHRLVLYLGYDFSDWIRFHSEWEIEHGFVADGAGGEFVIEQAYFDFLLSEELNIRAGRVLTPLGIINKWHEPTLFNSVERPSFAKFIIPSTWSSDGVGIFGRISESLSYEAYVVGGLDGSQFNATSGIRDGRIKERPSLHEPAVTGRLDYYAFRADPDRSLRIGLSGYYGGLDNGNEGINPGISGDIGILSADFQYTAGKFDFLGAVAHTQIDGAKKIGSGTAEEIFGWYLEGAYHIMPDEWKKGKLAKSDAVVFLRYDDFDTQYRMPDGVSPNPAGDRTEWTIGAAFWPTPNFVIKADYQIPDDATGDNPGHKINLGIGFAF
jgi:hypothetical protein